MTTAVRDESTERKAKNCVKKRVFFCRRAGDAVYVSKMLRCQS